MADADTNDCEQWITNRIDFTTGTLATGNSGDCEQWITGRIDFAEYVEVAAVPPAVVGVGAGLHALSALSGLPGITYV